MGLYLDGRKHLPLDMVYQGATLMEVWKNGNEPSGQDTLANVRIIGATFLMVTLAIYGVIKIIGFIIQ